MFNLFNRNKPEKPPVSTRIIARLEQIISGNEAKKQNPKDETCNGMIRIHSAEPHECYFCKGNV